jgi:hypothetical protein
MTDGHHDLGWLAVIQERSCEKCGLVMTHELPKLRRLASATKDR